MARTPVQISMSNLNLAPKDLLCFKSKDYIAALKKGGYDVAAGYEWSDTRFPRARAAAESLANLRYISVLHQSWREDRWRDVARRAVGQLGGHVVESAAVAAVFPLLDKSDRRLERVDEAGGATMPIIVHPAGQALDNLPPRRPRDLPDWPPTDTWFQPTAEWANAVGLDPSSQDIPTLAHQIVHRGVQQGMGGIVLDLHHLTTERMGYSFGDPAALAVQLAKSSRLMEIQPSIRPDFGGDQHALSSALNGNLATTKMGEMLMGISEALPRNPATPMRIVPEIRPAEIAAAGYQDYLAATAGINNSIREIFGGAA